MAKMEGLEVVDCTRCPALTECRTNIVNGEGPADADVVFVGEGPGADEDERGEPFVGRSGTVLDEALRAAGLAREDIRITNCVKCRPPENRDPHATELSNCREWLETELELIDPDVVVALGKVPSEHLLGRSVAVTTEAGEIERRELGGARRDVLVCVHPAAMFYDRSQQATFERTIRKAARIAGVEPPENEGAQSELADY